MASNFTGIFDNLHWLLLHGFCLVLLFHFVLFFETGFLCIAPHCPGTHSVNQASLELRDPATFASQVVELKACSTTAVQPGLLYVQSKHSTTERHSSPTDVY